MSVVDLEIGLHRWDASRYAVELRSRRPDDDADIAPIRGLATIDPAALLAADDDAFGPALSQALFADPGIREGFGRVRAVAQALDGPLRVRLFIGPSAP